MVKGCCAGGCTNCKAKGSTLSFPTDNDRRSQWIAAERIGARLNTFLSVLPILSVARELMIHSLLIMCVAYHQYTVKK